MGVSNRGSQGPAKRLCCNAAAWVRAARPLACANIAAPLLCGQALAWDRRAAFGVGALVLALVYGVCNQLYIVFLNDYADRRADELNREATFFSGGSRVLPLGLLAPAALRRAGLGAGAGALGIGLLCGLMRHSLLAPALVFFGLVLLWAYSFSPLKLNYRGGGEVLQGLGCGAILPLLGFYFQAGDLGAFPWEILPVLVAFNTVGSVATSLPDTQADRLGAKNTLAAYGGALTALRVALLLGFLGVSWSLALGVAASASPWPDGVAVALLGGAAFYAGSPPSPKQLLYLGVVLAAVPVAYAAGYCRLWWL
jgi:1,4-dihydroxy-2-naphthoate polyprenyltransferase